MTERLAAFTKEQLLGELLRRSVVVQANPTATFIDPQATFTIPVGKDKVATVYLPMDAKISISVDQFLATRIPPETTAVG